MKARLLAPFLIVALTVFGLTGCGDGNESSSGNDENAHESPEEEACEHLEEGPSEAITAAAEANASAPAVGDDHKRYDVTLVPGTGGNVGVIRLAVSEAGEYAVFLSKAIDLDAEPATSPGTLAPSSTVEGASTCAAVAQETHLNLEVGTYYLRLGPSSESSVSLVVEHAEHDDEHEG